LEASSDTRAKACARRFPAERDEARRAGEREGREGEKKGERYRRRKRGNCRELAEPEEMRPPPPPPPLRSHNEACDEDAIGAKHMCERERGTEL